MSVGWPVSVSRSLCLSVALALPGFAPELTGQSNGSMGFWEPPFQHVHAATTSAGVVGTDAFNVPLSSGFAAAYWPATTLATEAQPQFNATHMALIPRGPFQGCVLMWDHQDQPPYQDFQRYCIFDPRPGASPRFYNYLLPLPAGSGDEFCSGFAWTSNGDLFVAGGTQYPPAMLAGNLVFLFDPQLSTGFGYPSSLDHGQWIQQPSLQVNRWYPSVTATHRFLTAAGNTPVDCMIVSGGLSQVPVPGGGTSTLDPINSDYAGSTYEAYFVAVAPQLGSARLSKDVRASGAVPPTWSLPNGVFVGARRQQLISGYMGEYPRLHLLSDGTLFYAGWNAEGAKVDHEFSPGIWSPVAGALLPATQRTYVSSALFPIVNGVSSAVLRAGYGPYVEICHPLSTTNSAWVPNTGLGELSHPRTVANLVILPDQSFLMLGGKVSPDTSGAHEQMPEQYVGGVWRKMLTESSPRGYHGSALLLPDGRVLSAGGEDDVRTHDFQVFWPPYLSTMSARPESVTITPTNGVTFNSTLPAWDITRPIGSNPVSFTVEALDMPEGVRLEKAVLISPGCITHHSDFHQRCIEVASSKTATNQLTVNIPTSDKVAPFGYYMLFVVTNTGIPSEAVWIRIR